MCSTHMLADLYSTVSRLARDVPPEHNSNYPLGGDSHLFTVRAQSRDLVVVHNHGDRLAIHINGVCSDCARP